MSVIHRTMSIPCTECLIDIHAQTTIKENLIVVYPNDVSISTSEMGVASVCFNVVPGNDTLEVRGKLSGIKGVGVAVNHPETCTWSIKGQADTISVDAVWERWCSDTQIQRIAVVKTV